METGFLERQIYKMSAGIIKNSPQTRMKYKKKRVRERRDYGTITINTPGTGTGRAGDPENLVGSSRILSGPAGICPGLTGQEPIN